MSAKKQPTARTMDALRKLGWPAQIVEKWVQMRGDVDGAKERAKSTLLGLADALDKQGLFVSPAVAAKMIRGAATALSATVPGVRKDLWGCIDILALDGKPGCLGIQASVGGSVPARVKKALTEPLLRSWLAAGNRFQVWGWREVWTETGAKTKAIRWKARVVELHLDGEEIREREIGRETTIAGKEIN